MATEIYTLQGAGHQTLRFERSLHLPPDEASESLAGYDGVLAAIDWERHNAVSPNLPYRLLVPGIGVGTMAVAFCAYESKIHALNSRDIEIDGFDIDDPSVQYATLNMSSVSNERVHTNYFQADWDDERTWEGLADKRYNLVLFNPPYLPESEANNIATGYEQVPRQTLTGGIDGLEHFHAVLSRLPYVLDSEHGATVLFRFQTPGAQYVDPLKRIINESFGEHGITWPSGIFPTEGQASYRANKHGRVRWISFGRIVIPAASA